MNRHLVRRLRLIIATPAVFVCVWIYVTLMAPLTIAKAMIEEFRKEWRGA